MTPGARTNAGFPVGVTEEDELYDESAGYEDETGIRLAPGLSLDERRQATILYRLFNELWGVCITQGDPGSGKDLFGNYLAWKLKRYFPHKRILRDEKPRRLFGPYAGLFNEQVLVDDLARLAGVAKGVGATRIDTVMEKAADDWASTKGTVLLKNSVLYLAEYWRYVYNRDPHNPMNKTMGGVQKIKRHLDILVIGTTQMVEELDRRTAKPWIDWLVTCTKSVSNRTGFVYYIQKVKYDKRKDQFEMLGRPFPMPVDAGKPRTELGDGRIVVRRLGYRPESEEERIVLDVLHAGVDRYEGIVELPETDGHMCETETLVTLKELKFRKHKRVVDYPCFFGLYNSKSAVDVPTSLKGDG